MSSFLVQDLLSRASFEALRHSGALWYWIVAAHQPLSRKTHQPRMSTICFASKDQFEAAASWLTSTPATAGLPNEIKLELYGLFKFITTGAGPTSSRPSLFYPTNRAKHDAWNSVSTKYFHLNSVPHQTIAMAQGRYVEIAKQVGWDGAIQEEDEIDLERLSDSESEDGKDGHEGAKDGWRKVSVMQGEDGLDDEGTSPIHDAVTADSLQAVKKLIEGDSSLINSRDEFGYTPLHLAADRGYPKMTKLLLELGADKSLKDQDDQTPLMLAQISSRDDIIAILDPSS
ncbi:hypothetical protein J010_03886 [Cryptococcus neoformans]|nr:hypothetical protein C368_04071 [Cryptococcus neoformans var. grubii 125.91]OXG40212.1 hypothetical protein C359_03465 [Cryptococcus neoformans var. grubii Bt120]OXG49095.1 hypothetical protein C355_03782 [Cryptococcus neoformans var. grubii Th84]OXG78973.1 hypothetical protein C350_03858 [Cryptococcus neoformans var. grubii MW-RSA36]OXG85460.1 hypothetical protein C346_03922 [Cryptococcus neoformans var. grubii D17-1]OXG95177.1 hypothetical protein C345_03796 [Cryptococcus neoformans var. 